MLPTTSKVKTESLMCCLSCLTTDLKQTQDRTMIDTWKRIEIVESFERTITHEIDVRTLSYSTLDLRWNFLTQNCNIFSVLSIFLSIFLSILSITRAKQMINLIDSIISIQ